MSHLAAPVTLFTYNRPQHTQMALDALAANTQSRNSLLYIYCDGAKENADAKTIRNIEEVRLLARKETRFKEVIVIEQPKNKGLANSIIDGVTEVVNKYGKIIVLEDDIIVSKGFLKYMNDALTIYSAEDKVGCIHAWNYNLDTSNCPELTFFLKGADCWGWATWKRSWDLFNPNGIALLNTITANNFQYEFDRKGTHKFVEMLKEQIEGRNDSWAIRWHASLFLQDKYCLQPAKAIVKNIGLDDSGTHSGHLELIQMPVDFITLKKIPIQEDEWFFKAYIDSVQKNMKGKHLNKWQKLKALLKDLFHQ